MMILNNPAQFRQSHTTESWQCDINAKLNGLVDNLIKNKHAYLSRLIKR